MYIDSHLYLPDAYMLQNFNTIQLPSILLVAFIFSKNNKTENCIIAYK